MKANRNILHASITAALLGAAVPVASGMLLMFYQEISSAILQSALNLGKVESGAVMERVRRLGEWAVPVLNALLTAAAALIHYRRRGSRIAAAPLITGASSALSMLILGSLFSLSFNPAALPLGLWRFSGLFTTAAAGLFAGRAGLTMFRRKRRLLGLADIHGTARNVRAVIAAAGEAARHVAVNHICLVDRAGATEWNDRGAGSGREALRRFCTAAAGRIAANSNGSLLTHGKLPAEDRAGFAAFGFRSAAVIPLGDGKSAGVLLFLSRKRGAFGRRSWQLPIIASQVQLCLENIALLEEVKAASILEERQRLAGEIHDTVAQNLIGVILNLEAAQGGTAEEHIALALDTAKKSLQEARSVVWALKPTVLDDNPLSTALSRTLEEWSRNTRIDARFQVEGAPHRLPTDVEITVLRAQQEACANIARHADADTVRVLLAYRPNDVCLRVTDDGRGFDPSAVPGNGYGLTAMRQRVNALGGTLELDSPAGGGSEVLICIPMNPAADTNLKADVKPDAEVET